MAEPITHAAVIGGAAYVSGQTVAMYHDGMIMGAHPEAFILGLLGAFLVCAWQQGFDKPGKTYAGIGLAMLMAGYGSPAAAVAINHLLPFLTVESLFYIMPLVIGVIMPAGLPLAIRWATNKFGSANA